MMTNSLKFGEAAQEFFDRIGAEADMTQEEAHLRVGGTMEEGVMTEARVKMMISDGDGDPG